MSSPGGNCRNCGKPFTRPPQAKNKEFCSQACRIEHHNGERRRATRALEALRAMLELIGEMAPGAWVDHPAVKEARNVVEENHVKAN